MRILLVHPHDIHSDVEPWTVRITYLAGELAEAGHQVRLVHHGTPPGEAAAAPGNGGGHPFEVFSFPRAGISLGRRCRMMAGLAHWADVVHFQKCSHYAALPAAFAAYYHGRALHYDWDDWEQAIYELDPHSRMASWLFFAQMERRLLRVVDTLSVASEGLRTLALKRGFPPDRIFSAPVGADLESFSPRVDGSAARRALGVPGDGVPLVLYQGQISGANYVGQFLRAAALLAKERPEVAFAVVGGGDRLGRTKEAARTLGLGERIRFTGEVPHREVPGYIAAADVVVACFEDNPQARCKSPLKLVEYLASGKAIVASRVGEVPGMVGDAGVLVPPADAPALAGAVEGLLDDPVRRAELGRRARERAEERFTWKRTARTLERAYEKAIRLRHGIEGGGA